MAVSASRREEPLLKLVHPGRYVEIHREPISAAEVLKKNPRHSIARPDVFKFPWIVVRPDSVLTPGKVFYIVPNRTIHRLLKDRGFLSKNLDNRPLLPKQQQPSPGMTRRCLHKPFQFMSSDEASSSSSSSSSSEQLPVSHSIITFWVISNSNKHQESCSYYSDFSTDSSIDTIRPSRKNYIEGSTALAKTVCGGDDLKTKICGKTFELKTCLRKPDSARKMRNFKVTFA